MNLRCELSGEYGDEYYQEPQVFVVETAGRKASGSAKKLVRISFDNGQHWMTVDADELTDAIRRVVI